MSLDRQNADLASEKVKWRFDVRRKEACNLMNDRPVGKSLF